MTPQQRQHGIFFLVLRRLRAPLIVLIVIFAVSVLGLTLAPGSGAHGRLSFFHAFYFISYTATTIGFGEIPSAFSNQQRLWVIVCIYLSVIGWAYTLGSVLTLLADRNLHLAIRTQRFARAVRRLREPFYLVCGYGETGRLICRALDRMNMRAVVVEVDDAKVGELDLHGYTADVPALAADAGNPEILNRAGLTSPHCAGVIALTDDDPANLAIAISARLLAPRLPALCRAESPETAGNMASFGTRHIINPFEKFSEYMTLAVQSPTAWQLLVWLTSLPGSTVERRRDPPQGHWIVCGHGRFGKAMLSALSRESMPVTVIDRQASAGTSCHWIEGDGADTDTLLAAGAQQAAGLIAATDSDVDNLSIAVAARSLNRGLFIVLRQNHYSNRALFDAFDADLNMVPSEITAHECMAALSTPLLAPFLHEMKARDEEWREWLLKRLTGRFGWEAPMVWSERINAARAPALHRRLMAGEEVSLDTLLRSPRKRAEYLPCEVLYIHRDDGGHLLMPLGDTLTRPGDELLFAGHPHARDALGLSLANEQALAYLLTGTDLPGGWIWERMHRRKIPRSNRHLPG